jgi:hypothetical protein
LQVVSVNHKVLVLTTKGADGSVPGYSSFTNVMDGYGK